MTAVGRNGNQALWRLDSLADASRASEWKRADVGEEEPSLVSANSIERKKKKGLFSGIKSFVSDLMPLSLNSTVKSTRGNLKRVMTSQLSAMPADLPEGEGFDSLKDDEFAGFDKIEEEVQADIDFSTAFKTAGSAELAKTRSTELAGRRSADLVAAADAALAAVAEDTSSSAAAPTPAAAATADASGVPIAVDRKHSSAFAGGVPDSLRVQSSEEGSHPSSRAGSGTLRARPGAALGSTRSNHSIRSMRSSKSLGLPRAATLQRMETCNAWWELHELEVAEQQPDDATSDAGSESSVSRADATTVQDRQDALKSSSGKSSSSKNDGSKSGTSRSGSMSSMLVKSLAQISVSSWGSGITSRLSSLLQTGPSGPVFSTTLKKKGHTTVSTDGWTLHLVHTTDTALAPEQRKQHPILMCPGLASSGPGTFDLVPKVSIVDFLAAEGYDVWVIDIRGNGLADKTSRVDIEQDWNIDDYLVQDVPACIEYVLKHSPTKADKLHWMGHSMGGMLGSGLCSQAGKWSKRLRSVMLVGSGCFGDGSWHCLLKKLVVPLVHFGFPAHITTQGLALLANTPAALSVFETLFYWCPNMEKATRKALLATCFNFIPNKLVGQFLESHGSATGLTNVRGTFLYADPYVLAQCKVPALGLNGDWDLFCPGAGGERNIMLFGGYKKHLTFGPAFGHQFHYGHFDVIVGRNAQQEVWPHVKEFLDTHDTPATVAELWPHLE